MEYWIAWLRMFALKFEICMSRFCITLLFIGFVANRAEKRYCFWFAIPKFSLIITNENNYPYVPEVWYWKFAHIHLVHVLGGKLQEIPHKVNLEHACVDLPKAPESTASPSEAAAETGLGGEQNNES